MGDEGVDEVGGIEHQQEDRDAEAQPLVDQQGVDTGSGNPLGEDTATNEPRLFRSFAGR
jgi:hypothetical protein